MKLPPITEHKSARKTQVTYFNQVKPITVYTKLAIEGYVHLRGATRQQKSKFAQTFLGKPVMQPGNKVSTIVKPEKAFFNRTDGRSKEAILPHTDLSHAHEVPRWLSLDCVDPGEHIKPTGLVNLKEWFMSLPVCLQEEATSVVKKHVNDFTDECIEKPIIETDGKTFTARLSSNVQLLGQSSPAVDIARDPFKHAVCDAGTYALVKHLYDFCCSPSHQIWCYLEQGDLLIFSNTTLAHFVTQGRPSGRQLERIIYDGQPRLPIAANDSSFIGVA